MDADEIFSKQLQQMEKEKKERDNKLKSQEKKVWTLITGRCTFISQYLSFWQIDYFERAKRMVEIPLLTKQYEEQKEKDRQFHDEYEEERVSLAQATTFIYMYMHLAGSVLCTTKLPC